MLKKLFAFDPQRTNIKTEIFAGLTSFLTMSYILAVNPSIFSSLEGMPQTAVFTATALVAFIGSMMMALLAKMPFGIAPGMGTNGFFVFTICLGMGYSWQFALTAIFIEGCIMLLLTLSGLREALVNILPKSIKQAISIGIGLFIAFVGLQNSGIIVDDTSTLVRFGSITEGKGLLSIIGLAITGTLVAKKVKGGMLIGILLTTLIGIPLGQTHYQGIIGLPQSVEPIFCQFDFSKLLSMDMLVVVLSFLFIDLFSLTGSVIAICQKGGFVEKDGSIPGVKRIFIADSTATICASLLGTSSACTLIEGSAGVSQGGRSGLTALTIALCFAASLFFAPLFLTIPQAATSPVLIIVGLMMFGAVKEIDMEDLSESIPSFITIIVMPLAYSIADGILLGVISYVIINALSGKFKKLSVGLCILASLFVLKYIFL